MIAPGHAPFNKIQNLAELRKWRGTAVGPVVFTNGVFDILHPGHVHLLHQARSLGNSLIVGINSDSSVKLIGKGINRPVLGEWHRAAMVAAVGAVERVGLFDEPNPVVMIEALRPDIIVKGDDYTVATVAGADLVASWGGQVHIVPRLSGYSSTLVLENICAAIRRPQGQ